jgi:Ser/Thr protein kinase RdoA (MazF antagonist)
MAFPVNCSTPSSAALAEYLPSIYNIGAGSRSGVECFFAGQGWSDVYLVRAWNPLSAQPERFFLKVYAPAWRTESDILFELEFIRHLDRKGLSVVLPLPCRDGTLIHPLELPEGTRSMVLFRNAPGRPLSEQPAEVQSRLLGTIMAQIDAAAEDFASAHRRAPLDLDRLLDLSPLAAFASEREDDLAHLRQIADRVREVLDTLPLAALCRGVCHGDLGGPNIFLEGGPESRATVIDFDDCGPGWYAYDLGHVFMFLHLFRADQAGQLWQTFLEGYRSRASLDEVEVAAAPAFALARLLQVHAHDNPLGAARDRWPASGYADGSQWDWVLKAAQTLETRLPKEARSGCKP